MNLIDISRLCFFKTCVSLVIFCMPLVLCGQSTLENQVFEQSRNQAISHLQSGKAYQCLHVAEKMDSLVIDSMQWAVVQYIKGAAYVHLKYHDRAYTYLQKALSYFRSVGDKNYLARTYSSLGKLSFYRGQMESGMDFFQKSFDLYKEAGNLPEMYKMKGNMGIMSAQLGATTKAAKEFKAVKRLAAEQGDSAAMVPAYLNLGQLFIRTNQPDSVLPYIRKALRLGEKYGTAIGQADGFNSLSGYYFMKEQYDSAHYYGNKALEIYKDHQQWEDATRILHRMASSKEELGEYPEATQLQWEHIAFKDSVYDHQKQHAIAEAESKFKLSEKNHKIALLEAHSEAETRQKWLYLTLMALAGAIALIIAFKFRHQYKLREREKKIHQQQLALEATQKQKLEDELQLKERALTKESLRIVQKNQQFEEVQEKLHSINDKLKGEMREDWVAINSSIKYALSVDKEWEEFSHYFESLHPKFQKALNAIEPHLTEKEKRLCALTKINMNTREIASLLRISPASVKKARQRLRKKLGLNNHDLNEYLDEISQSFE